MIKNKNILVTGGAGFIGSTLANRLLADGNRVTALDDLSMGNWANLDDAPALTRLTGSIADATGLSRLLSEQSFDYIFHLAAVASVADSVARPVETHQVNFAATQTLLELLRQGAQPALQRFVFTSSAAVYGDEPSLPKREESVIRPLTPYAIDKFASERLAMMYDRLYGVPTAASRFFNVYGPKQNPASPYSGVLSIILNRLRSHQRMTLYGDGAQSRDFVYVEDAVDALLLIATADSARGETFNVATGRATTLTALVEAVERLSADKLDIQHAVARPGDIRHSQADIAKLSALGYQPRYSLADGLKKYLEYTK